MIRWKHALRLQRVLAWAAGAVWISGLALGCSNRDEASSVGDEFASQALEICHSIQQSKDAWSAFPVPGFNPTEPDAAQFPQVAAWLEQEVGPTFDAWYRELVALGTPPTGREAWADVLAAVDQIARLNADQVEAAKGNDAKGFVAATNGLQAAQTDLEGATDDAGVAKCADVHAG